MNSSRNGSDHTVSRDKTVVSPIQPYIVGHPTGMILTAKRICRTFPRILLIDGEEYLISAHRRVLSRTHPDHVHLCHNVDESIRLCREQQFDILFISTQLQGNRLDGFELSTHLRVQGYSSYLALVNEEYTADLFFKAARYQADDYLVDGPFLDLDKEVSYLKTLPLSQSLSSVASLRRLGGMGFFRSNGLTAHEMLILEQYAKGLLSYKEMSKLLNRSESYIRKIFSSIFAKLNLRSLHQLSQIITIAAMFRTSKKDINHDCISPLIHGEGNPPGEFAQK